MSESNTDPPPNDITTPRQFQSSVKTISSIKKGSLPPDSTLFSTVQLSNRAENYNIMDPYPEMNDAFLQEQSPNIFLFRNKPQTIKPDVNNTRQQRSKTAHSALRSSILQKRPLTSLKEPTILSTEIVQRKIDEERQTISFEDDPLAYFSKKKDGRGHRFIYLVYQKDPSDPSFSPYELEKVPSALIGRNFFTMSATCIIHTYPDGTTETFPLNQWANEKSHFDILKKLKFFATFHYWKSYRIWKNFVMQQRYGKLENKIVSHPFFRNSSFFKQSLVFYNWQLKLYEMLRTLLLTFHSQRKYKLEEFKELSYNNIQKLKSDYEDFINETINEICQLYTDISDPRLVQVQDSDFPEIKRRNPNLSQLLLLEKTKAEKRYNNTLNVNNEIEEIGGYIRMIDYMLLETLVDGCLKCWKIADENVSQPESNIFQVEVLFDEDGKVIFNPKFDDLMETISDVLDTSVYTLQKLPRLLYQQQFQPFLKDNGSDIAKLQCEGPNFNQIMSFSTLLKTVKEHILEIVSNSYKEAFLFSQTFADFYPIFKHGKTWNVRDYVFTKSGKKYDGPIIFDSFNNHSTGPPQDFLLHSDEEPIVDFIRVAQDIEKFREDIKRVNNLRSGAIRGAIFIDSHGLKASLIPIPQRSLLELQDLLTNITAKKTWQLNNALKFYSLKLKIVPQTLDDFVSFCAIFAQTIKVLPQIREDIEFIDKMYKMFDDFGFVHTQNIVHASYSVFITDQTNAQTTRDDSLGMFTDALRGSLRQIEARIRKLMEKASDVPLSIKDADIDKDLPSAKKLLTKIECIRPKVQTAIQHQKVMSVQVNNFESYDNLVKAGQFLVKLYESLDDWSKISFIMTHVAFAEINMTEFHNDIDKLKSKADDLQSSISDIQCYPILNELNSRIQDTTPFIEQLEYLAFGKMQLRHWNLLFEACDRQNAYHSDITIEELMNLGILRARDKIAEITATSQGESELESEFLAITNHWNKVQIPLADSPSKVTEDNLLLGPTEPLLIEIQDALVSLNKMLSFPYVQGIKDSVTTLYATLENLSSIIEAWQLFQMNWVILSALFSMDEAKSILPNQTNKFSSVQRKWAAIARFTIKDPRLFQVATYPSLLAVLSENNIIMESITASLGKFIDAKRFNTPRLCFLSNEEVLTIAASLKNFPSLISNLKKIFMYVKHIDCHENDNDEGEENFKSNNIQQLKFYGFIGEDGTSIQFEHPVVCKGQMDVWISHLITEMKSTVKNKIIEVIKELRNGKDFTDWIIFTTPYIQLIALHAEFTNEIEKCLASKGKEQYLLNKYEAFLIDKIRDIKNNIIDCHLFDDQYKYSCTITQLIKFRDQVHALSESEDSFFSSRWANHVKVRYESSKSNINRILIEYMDQKFEHGYEYWGKVPYMIYSPSISDSISSLTFCWMKQKIPLLNSTHSSGKQLLIKSCACLGGSFAFIVRSFPDLSEFTLSRLLIGAISSGAWLIFSNADTLSYKTLCFLFDTIRLCISSYKVKAQKITINSHQADFNRNCRIFLTANVNYLNSKNLPSQLKSYSRPIALIPPSLNSINEIRLMSIGFKNSSLIAQQITSFINSVYVIIHQVKACPSPIIHAVEIIEQANNLVKKHENLENNFAVAFSCYERFICVCDETRKLLLQRILYTSFQIGSSAQELITKIEEFKLVLINETIRNAIQHELSNFDLDLPIQYLCDQTMNLISLMRQFFCILIVGPPNSGKSTIIKVLSKVFEREEVLSSIEGSKPYLVTPIFPQSDSFRRVFGYAYEDPVNGPIFSFGFFQSAMYFLRKITKKNHILKIDGKLTDETTQFLSQFIGSHDDKKFMLNTLDTLDYDDSNHIMFETSNLGNASPLFVSKCGILLMHNLQIASPISPALPVCRLVYPNIPFSRAFHINCQLIEGNLALVTKKIFGVIAPTIVKYIYYTPNIVCYADYAKRLESGTIILTDILSSYAAIIGMYLIHSYEISENDESSIKLALILGFFQACCGILEFDQIKKFDKWLQDQFDIRLPDNWIGYNVSDSFWDCYNKPSLISMTISYKGKYAPLDFQPLNDPVSFTSQLDDEKENEDPPFMLKEVKVCHAQILPQLKTCEILLNTNQNIIIHGPPGSGKTSFLEIFFAKKDSYIPVFINISDSLDIESIISYIAIHTPLLSKATTPNTGSKTFVIIFDGIKPHHIQIIEFIRMIITNRTFPLNSQNDEKVFEFAKVHPFNIIVTTQNYKLLPSRFLVNFCPIQLEPLTELTSSFIAKKILMTYGYEDTEIESIIKLASIVLIQYPCHSLLSDLLLICSTLCFIDDKRNNTIRIAALLSDLYYITLHRFNKSEIAEKITFIFQSECNSESDVQVLNRFLSHKTILYSQYNLSRDNKEFNVQVQEQSMSSVIKTLKDNLLLYNLTSIEKIILRFTPHVVNEWSLLYQAISCPGRNVILEGRTGSGRYSMTRFIAQMCECDFVYIADPTPEELLAVEDRKAVIIGILKDAISNAAIQQKRSVIFIRATNKNENEIRLVADCISNEDVLSIFIHGSVEELYERITSSHNMTYKQRNSAVKILTDFISMNIHVVISKSSDVGYEINYNGFNTILFNSETDQALHEIALEAIENPQTKKILGSLSQPILKILPKVPRIALSASVNVHTNQFYDFVDTFAHFSASDIQDINIKNDNIQSALTFIEQLENEAHLIEKRLDAITPALNKLQGDSDTLHSTYSTRKETIISRREKVEQEFKNKNEEVAEIEKQVKVLKEERIELEPHIKQYKVAVENLTENEIETIRITAIAPPYSLQLLLEIFCYFLDLTPSYENGGKKLLMDPHFVKNIISKVTHMTITPELLSRVLPYFEQPDLNPTSLENSAPALRVLYEWIHAVCELHRLKFQYKDQTVLLEKKKKELEEFKVTMKAELASIEQVEQSLESENKAMEQSALSRVQMEKEFKQIELRKKLIDHLFTKMDQLTNHWNIELKEYSSDKNKIIGNSILFAFYLVYCGGMTIENRRKSLDSLVELLSSVGIETMYYKQPLEDIKNRFVFASPSDHVDRSPQAAIDAHHATTTLRTPLIIDPDGIVTNYITNGVKHKNLITVSQYSVSLDAVVSMAISNGKTLVITDVDDLNPVVASILSLDIINVDPKMSLEIRVGSKLVTWDQKFKLFLTSSVSNSRRLPDSLLARVTLIDVTSSSLASSYESIANTFIDYFNPELSSRFKEMKSKLFEYKIELNDYERQTLSILADIVATQIANPKYDFLNDDETMSEFNYAKDSYLFLLNCPPTFAAVVDEYNQMMNPFNPHVVLCHDFWTVMSREIPIVNKTAFFSFHNYLRSINSLFTTEGYHPGILSADQHSALNHSLIHMTFQFVANKIPYKDFFFFLFMSGFTAHTHINSAKYNDSELFKVLAHIRDEVTESKCEYLAKDKDKNKNRLTEEAYDHLVYTNVINLFHYMSRFVVENYGPDYSNYFSYFQFDSLISNSASFPTIIVANEEVDPTPMLLYFISKRCKNENFDVISLTDDLEQLKEAKKSIGNAQIRGSMVLIYYSNPSIAVGSMLSEISSNLMTNSVNANFRLIILATSLMYLSPTMLVRCKRITLDNFPNIRSLMLEMIQIFPLTKKSQDIKLFNKILYSVSLLFSLVHYRQFIKPFGFSSIGTPNKMSIFDSIEILLSMCENELSVPNFRDEIMTIAFSYLPELRDKTILSSFINQILSNNLIEDDFSVSDGNSKVRNKEKWIVPSSTPIANFINAAQLLPVFPSPEILGINGHQIRNWTMAIWVSSPFVKFSYRNVFRSKKDTISQSKSGFHYISNDNEKEKKDKPISPETSTTSESVKNKQARVKYGIFINSGSKYAVKFNFEQGVIKIGTLVSSLPKKIGTGDYMKFTTVFGVFLLSEVEKLNSIIIFLRTELETVKKELLRGFVSKKASQIKKNQIPHEWKRFTNFWISRNLEDFVSFINASHRQLAKMIKNGTLYAYDVRYFLNTKLLFQSFLLQFAIDSSISVDKLKYEFHVSENSLFELSESPHKQHAGTLLLKGLSLGLGAVNNGLLEFIEDQKSSPFQSIGLLIAQIVMKDRDKDKDKDKESDDEDEKEEDLNDSDFADNVKKGRIFNIPLYHQAFVDLMNVDKDAFDVENNCAKNFIWDIELRTEEDNDLLLKSGISMFCRVPKQIL